MKDTSLFSATLLRVTLLFLSVSGLTQAQNSSVLDENIKTLMVHVDDHWRNLPVVCFDEGERIDIRFDCLNYGSRRYRYAIKHFNADWTESNLPITNYLVGFNGQLIENYTTSRNTLVPYTHYHLTLPNRDVRVTHTGNYEVRIYDEGASAEKPVAIARFTYYRNQVGISAEVTTNTSIDFNKAHQQVSLRVNYGTRAVSNPHELQIVVRQNNRPDNQVFLTSPTFITPSGVEYRNHRQLIFAAGNEFRRIEMTSYRVPGMGVRSIEAIDDYYHATLYAGQPRHNYIYDEDQNGAFLIRAIDMLSSASDAHTESEYLFTHFTFVPSEGQRLPEGKTLYIIGNLTHNQRIPAHQMHYNAEVGVYEASLLLKQGYYNYQYFVDGASPADPIQPEGNFYETRNEYQILIYHRPFGNRADECIGFRELDT